MSRRTFLQAVGLVVAVLLVVLEIRVATGSDERAVRGADQAVAGPVLLVPGYGGATGALEVLARKLQAAGRATLVVPLPGDNTGDLRAAADAVADAVDREIAAGAPSVDLVGYSAGGVIARLYVAGPGATKVRRVITLGSPHHGTKVAALAVAFASASCPEACRQLAPDSDLLDGLEDTPPGPLWFSLWTADDKTVTPPTSARLDDAVNTELQDVCPGLRVSHGELPTTPLVAGIVIQALGVGPLAAPSGCAALTRAGA